MTDELMTDELMTDAHMTDALMTDAHMTRQGSSFELYESQFAQSPEEIAAR